MRYKMLLFLMIILSFLNQIFAQEQAISTSLSRGIYSLTPGTGEPIPITKQGKAIADIIVPDKGIGYEIECAKELSDYLEKISGAKCLTVFESKAKTDTTALVLGQTNSANRVISISQQSQVSDEGFYIKSAGQTIYIWAKTENGLWFAVSAFLEHLGVRWFTPFENGTVIPNYSTLIINPIDALQNPSFKKRMFWNTNGWLYLDDYNEKLSFWYRRNRFNLWRSKPTFNWDECSRDGIFVAHNLYVIVPIALYDKHPEYFPEINGKRVRPILRDRGWQPCTSNPEVIDLAVQAAREYFVKFPQAVSFSLTQNDMREGWCECDQCRALDPPGDPETKTRRLAIFANAVAQELAKSNPGKYVALHAYTRTMIPPQDIEIRDNIIFSITHYEYACDEKGQRLGNSYREIQDLTSPENTRFRKILEQWARKTRKLAIREYYTCSGEPVILGNITSAFICGPDLKYLHGLGVEYFDSEASGYWGIDGPVWYLTGRLLWNVNLDIEKVWEDYYQKFFGPAGDSMKEYFACILKQVRSKGTPENMEKDETTMEEAIMDPDFLERCDALLRKAAEKATTPVISYRIRMFQDALTYQKLTANFYNDSKWSENDYKRQKGINTNYSALLEFARSIQDTYAVDPARVEPLYSGTWPIDEIQEEKNRILPENGIKIPELLLEKASAMDADIPMRGENTIIIPAKKEDTLDVTIWTGSGFDEPIRVWAFNPGGEELSVDGLPTIVQDDDPGIDRTKHFIPSKAYWNRVFLSKTSKKLGPVQAIPPKSSRNLKISCKLDGLYTLWTYSKRFNGWIKTNAPAVFYNKIMLRSADHLRLYFQIKDNIDAFSLLHSGNGTLKVFNPSGQIVAEVKKGQGTKVGFLDIKVPVNGNFGIWSVVLDDKSLVKLGSGKGLYPFFVKASNN